MYRCRQVPQLSALDYVQYDPQRYLDAHSANDRPDVLMTSAAVFRTIENVPWLLLLQRSEEDSLPGLWELPGGSVDEDDATLRLAVARELKEETGLTLAWIVQEVSRPVVFTAGRSKFSKICFVVEVDEIGSIEFAKPGQASVTNGATAAQDVPIALNPAEHQRHLWATRAQVETLSVNGVELRLTGSTEFQKILLQGFDIQEAMIQARQEQSGQDLTRGNIEPAGEDDG